MPQIDNNEFTIPAWETTIIEEEAEAEKEIQIQQKTKTQFVVHRVHISNCGF